MCAPLYKHPHLQIPLTALRRRTVENKTGIFADLIWDFAFGDYVREAIVAQLNEEECHLQRTHRLYVVVKKSNQSSNPVYAVGFLILCYVRDKLCVCLLSLDLALWISSDVKNLVK